MRTAREQVLLDRVVKFCFKRYLCVVYHSYTNGNLQNLFDQWNIYRPTNALRRVVPVRH